MNPLGGHKMAQMPVKKLLLNIGTPMMISMLGQALYNVVDTFFVSHIPDTAAVADMGDKAINALAAGVGAVDAAQRGGCNLGGTAHCRGGCVCCGGYTD